MSGGRATFYHGISTQMLFDSTTPEIFSPLSTTCEYSIALHFANTRGMIVELAPDAELKYFQCYYVSDFAYEREALFIGGFGRINFLNLTSMESNICYGPYIDALRIIDTMMQGVYFMNDPSDIHKIKENDYCKDVSKLKLEPLHRIAKQLCFRLISDKLYRNGIISINNMICVEFKSLNEYTRLLLDQIWNSKKSVVINLKVINTTILDKCDDLSGGYIGYSFLKPLFFYDNGGINLNVLIALFPGVLYVKIDELPLIDSNMLNHVYHFIVYTQCKIRYFELNLSKGNNNVDKFSQMTMFSLKFKRIGFDLQVNELCQIIITQVGKVQFRSFRSAKSLSKPNNDNIQSNDECMKIL
eukprot:22076_1